MKKCMYPHCRHPKDRERIRGLCRTCYTLTSRYVRMNITTWQKLERAGKVLPSIYPSRKMGRGPCNLPMRDWILSKPKKEQNEKT